MSNSEDESFMESDPKIRDDGDDIPSRDEAVQHRSHQSRATPTTTRRSGTRRAKKRQNQNMKANVIQTDDIGQESLKRMSEQSKYSVGDDLQDSDSSSSPESMANRVSKPVQEELSPSISEDQMSNLKRPSNPVDNVLCDSSSESSLDDAPQKQTPTRNRRPKRLQEKSCSHSSNSSSGRTFDEKPRRLRRLRKKTRRQVEVCWEAEELRKDAEFMTFAKAKPRESWLDSDSDSVSDGREEDEALPISPLCRICSKSMRQGISQRTGNLYYCCSACEDSFMWLKEAKKHLPGGPCCDCGHPSYPIKVRGEETCLWVCANTDGAPCRFEQPIRTESNCMACDSSAAITVNKRNDKDAEFILGDETKWLLQQLLHLSYQKSRRINHNDPDYYDYLQVEQAWRIIQPDDTINEFEQFREDQDCKRPIDLDSEYASAVQSLLQGDSKYIEPLHESANELLLLHGTKPEVVASILEKSLDPGMAQLGIFGRGTYFADHPAKIDQYTKAETSALSLDKRRKLHKKLFPTADLHPGNVRYALVCRVIMGDPDVTHVSKTQPAAGHHSILAAAGGVGNFREYVVFDRRAIKIEFLVCYSRVKRYCKCGEEVRQRTFFDQSEDIEREIIACRNSYKDSQTGRWEGGCGLSSPLPRCFCRTRIDFFKAGIETSRGNRLWCCKRLKCNFTQPIEADSLFANDRDSEEDEDQYDYDDDFIVKG